MIDNLTFIVCTKNSISTIKNCLESLKNYKVVLVDKDSKDGTLEVAMLYGNIKIIKQNNFEFGIANAKNKALKEIDTDYVCLFGSDNMLPVDFENIINKVIKENLKGKNIGTAFLTEVFTPRKYLDKCINIWWRGKFKKGVSKVIGTPCIYKTKILKEFGFSEFHTYSDDTDLGERLAEKNYLQNYNDFVIYDVSKNNLKEIKRRWTVYGISDNEYHIKYCNTLNKKIKSYLHTLTSDFVPKLYYLPFYFLITYFRFKARILNNLKIKRIK